MKRSTSLAIALGLLLVASSGCKKILAAARGKEAPAETTAASGFAGVYAATYDGTWQNTSPNKLSGSNTSPGTITVSDSGPNEVTLVFQVPPNPPSGGIVFTLNGASGVVKQCAAIGGACFNGVVDGNHQTNCCDTCSVTFTGKALSQPNAGHYTGTTQRGVPYSGTYSGSWVGSRP